MIFGEQSLKLKVSHAADVDLERRLVEAFAHRRFDVAGCRDKLERYGPALASGGVVNIRPGSMNAAGRLTDWQRNGT